MIADLVAFAGVAAVVNITPGLDTVLVLRNSMSGGRAAGFAAGLGINTGCAVWGLAAAIGLTALLAASHVAFDVLRVAGAMYLVWLGGSALWRSRRPGTQDPASARTEDVGAPSSRPAPGGRPQSSPARMRFAAFGSGLKTNLLNPKAGIFYMSLLPQFLPHGAPVFSTTMLLTAVDVTELVIWFYVISRAVSAVSGRIRRPAFQRRMEQVSGVVFLGFAADLIVEGR
jgi:threonine/homoserine/homoserine lactone efflux protein